MNKEQKENRQADHSVNYLGTTVRHSKKKAKDSAEGESYSFLQ